ncbi:MAG TPA: DUF1801 domain-containing protein [Saprospiraceae bacterium]|nr:DUF1801 domain-containing protein [Saprospiraceae bacterium]
MNTDFKTVDEYIASFPKSTQEILKKIRKTVKTKASGAIEGISYGMPAYKLNGKSLVYFGGYKNHIGFYATPSGHASFQKELANYKQGKGSVQFPLDQIIPYDLIGQMVEFRVEEVNLNTTHGKKNRSK